MIEIPGVIITSEHVLKLSPPIWQAPFSMHNPDDLSRFACHKLTPNGLRECEPNSGPQSYKSDIGRFYYLNPNARCADVDEVIYAASMKNKYDFAVFAQMSERSQIEGYLTQARFVSRLALRFMFGLLSEEEFNYFPLQSLPLDEAMKAFMKHQIRTWGRLTKVAFGLMIENSGIYRVWSYDQLSNKQTQPQFY
ncbi:hypothetical protein HY385_01765 [Candidatus Daviesbacteria bacterium]|nr:hypothetical protein [Candidatus Daviesbacteria bacterium]